MSRNFKHNFASIPTANIPRSTFDRSHTFKTTFNAGSLIPIYVDEVLPGDTFNLKLSTFVRMSTPVVPIMDNLYMDMFFFFVPNRLIWDNWQRFCGENDKAGTQTTDYMIPRMNLRADMPTGPGELADYFALPCYWVAPSNFPDASYVSALPFRAYGLIWNEWFRDENLQDSVPVKTDDGPDLYREYDISDSTLLPRGKRHDYFTSCLPWPQKGPNVALPLGDKASVSWQTTGTAPGDQPCFRNPATGERISAEGGSSPTSLYPFGPYISAGTSIATSHVLNNKDSTFLSASYDPMTSLYADLSGATAATINQIRLAFQLQKLYERDARGGTRYTEILRSHFGVVSPDSRLQRPEYLGGGSTRVHINPVSQTSATITSDPIKTTPQGNLAAYGIASSHGHGFVKSFVEHGYIIGMVAIRADLTYQQNVRRMWSRKTRWDFYWPALAHIGEQAVLNQEIFSKTVGIDADELVWDNNGVFGYQERWAEYRYFPSSITGMFRSKDMFTMKIPPSDYASLDFWHLSQAYRAPKLNSDWIQDKPPIDRVIAVPSISRLPTDFLFDSHLSIKCARPMPVYSVPGLIDHF